MDLTTFVAETLTGLVNGIKKAQENAQGKGALIVPSGSSGKHGDAGHEVSDVEFDIAVTVTEEDKKKGGGAIKILVFNLNGEKSNSSANTTVSRIKFTIPVGWPDQLAEKTAEASR